jgi:hypothetical protein
LALGGATIGTNALAVTGTTALSGLLTAAGGVSSTLTTDATSATTGSIITAGGISTQKALWVGTTSQHVGAATFNARITQALTASAAEYALKSSGQTTGWIAIDMANTGGDYIIAGENSAGNNLISGDTAYDMVIRAPSGIAFSANAGTTQHARLTSAGAFLVGAATDSGSGGKIAATSSGYVYGAASTVANSSDVYYFNFVSSVGGQNGYIYRPTASGVLQLVSASDARLKDNIVDAKFSGLGVISAVKVREFDWKDGGAHSVGFIAQELHPICPDAVAVGEDDADGNIKRAWAIGREALVPYLIKAVQELTIRLEALETK